MRFVASVLLVFILAAFILAAFILAAFILVSATPALAGVFVKSDREDNDPFIIVHPLGYTGVGGELTVKICATAGSQTVVPATRKAIDLWNELEATTNNCTGNCLLWEDPVSPPGILKMSSTLLHELGHCAMGLGHVNSGLTSFTNSRDFTSIYEGADSVRGSSDDDPSPLPGTRVIHWFRKLDNDPFAIDGLIVDEDTYTRRILDLPSGDSWPESGNRAVGDLLGLSMTQAVMYSRISCDQTYLGLSGDDVSTVKFGMTGLDMKAGTADDYTVHLVFQGDCSSADIQIDFDVFPDMMGPAVCLTSINNIENIHYRVAADPILFDKPTIFVKSSKTWDVIFADGFESGDMSGWSSAQ